jgi:ribonuclease HI
MPAAGSVASRSVIIRISRKGRLKSRPFFLSGGGNVSFDLRALKIYIDGSCWKNPGGAGGFAARIEYPFGWDLPDELIDCTGYFETNNNRMELCACVFAYEWILEQGKNLSVQHVQIVTDSKYVFDNYHRAVGWSTNGWRNVHGRPMENVDLWKDLLRVRRKLGFRIRVEVKLIAGKSTPITKMVDREAKAAAALPTEVDRGFRSGKIGRAKNNTGKAGKLFPAPGQEITIRVYQTMPIRRGEQNVKFQLYSEQAKDFIEKFVAYADAALCNELHRQHAYVVHMNDIAAYPRILEIVGEVKETDLVLAATP